MSRLTKEFNGKFYIDNEAKVQHDANGYFGEAVSRLGNFENIYDDLISRQEGISKELEELRSEGKIHTVKFKQLLVDKINNKNIIMLFETYGCD